MLDNLGENSRNWDWMFSRSGHLNPTIGSAMSESRLEL